MDIGHDRCQEDAFMSLGAKITAGRVRVSPPLNLHLQNDKLSFVGRNHLAESLGQKAKASTKVVLYDPQKQRIQKK